MQALALTPTSYVVLGLLEARGPSTPYELKQAVAMSVGNLWSVPHSQVYAEPQRLARAGFLAEQRETTGRRRRSYALTERGRQALDDWRAEATSDLPEIRDPALLKLFFGARPDRLAKAQLAAHRAKLAEYEALMETDTGDPPRGGWQALAAGIAHEREWVRYWDAVLRGDV